MAEKRRPPGKKHYETIAKERYQFQRQLEVKRLEKLKQEIKECTFTPKIIKINWKDITLHRKEMAERKGSKNSSGIVNKKPVIHH